MTRLWDKGTPLDARVLAYTAGEDHALDNRLVRLRHPRLHRARGNARASRTCCRPRIIAAIREALDGHRRGARAGAMAHHARAGGLPDGHREFADRSASARPAADCMPAARATIRCSRRCACTCAMRREALRDGALGRRARRSTALAARHGAIELPGYTHMQQAMPSTRRAVGLRICRGTARRCGGDSRLTQRRIGKNPAGIRGRVRHPESRHQPRGHPPALGFARHAGARNRGAAVARQGRGAAAVRDHAADPGHRPSRGRPAAVLHPGIRIRGAAGCVHHRLIDHAAEAQSRCVRADARHAARWRKRRSTRCSASRRSSPRATTAILQLIKPPLFRGIDSCRQTLDILPGALEGVRFPARKTSGWIPGIHAAAAANALVAKEEHSLPRGLSRAASAARSSRSRE